MAGAESGPDTRLEGGIVLDTRQFPEVLRDSQNMQTPERNQVTNQPTLSVVYMEKAETTTNVY